MSHNLTCCKNNESKCFAFQVALSHLEHFLSVLKTPWLWDGGPCILGPAFFTFWNFSHFFSIFHIIQNSRLRASFHITSGHRYFEAAHFYALWRFPLIFLWWFSNISPWLHHTVSWPFETSKQRRNKKVVKKPHRNYYPRDGNFRLPSYFFILWSNWVHIISKL